jgi:ribosomal protein L40E
LQWRGSLPVVVVARNEPQARQVDRGEMMDTRECPACGHQNNLGAMSCAACFTSLNLKLCQVCEAANPLTAEKCRDCGAPLVEGAPADEVPAPVAAAERLFEEAPRIRLLPLRQHAEAPARSGRLASLWIVSVAVAAGGGYYLASRVPLPVALPAPAVDVPQACIEPALSAPQARFDPPPPQEPQEPAVSSVTEKSAKLAVAQGAAPEPAAAPFSARVTHLSPGVTVEKPAEPVSEKSFNKQPAGCAPR